METEGASAGAGRPVAAGSGRRARVVAARVTHLVDPWSARERTPPPKI